MKGADNEEKVVYNLIEEAGNKGIWIRDIRVRSNLANTQLIKVLKSLESKKLIKAVKCVNVSYIIVELGQIENHLQIYKSALVEFTIKIHSRSHLPFFSSMCMEKYIHIKQNIICD